QRDIYPTDGGTPYYSVPMPKVLPIHHLPQVLNTPRILANKELGYIFDRTYDTLCMPFQGSLSPSPQPRLICHHFDKDPVSHTCMTHVSFNCSYFHIKGNNCPPYFTIR